MKIIADFNSSLIRISPSGERKVVKSEILADPGHYGVELSKVRASPFRVTEDD